MPIPRIRKNMWESHTRNPKIFHTYSMPHSASFRQMLISPCVMYSLIGTFCVSSMYSTMLPNSVMYGKYNIIYESQTHGESSQSQHPCCIIPTMGRPMGIPMPTAVLPTIRAAKQHIALELRSWRWGYNPVHSLCSVSGHIIYTAWCPFCRQAQGGLW